MININKLKIILNRKNQFLALFLFMCQFINMAYAQTTIHINKSSKQKFRYNMVVAPGYVFNDALTEAASIINKDLAITALFDQKTTQSGTDFLITYGVRFDYEAKEYVYSLEILDNTLQKKVKKITGQGKDLRNLSHHMADHIFQSITSIPGIFKSLLLYVSKEVENGDDVYYLYKSDFDGQRKRPVVKTKTPILSPTWHPNQSEIAYVQYENDKTVLYVQDIYKATRKSVVNLKGTISSPTWSRDGRYLAFASSHYGSFDIYVLDQRLDRLSRLTKHNAIDTEPNWSHDGSLLYFTSDRGGQPQVYKYQMKSGNVKRVTFKGRYNAAPTSLPDNQIMTVHRSEFGRGIALFNLSNNCMRMLTSGIDDESIALADNGVMAAVAAKVGDKRKLKLISVTMNISTTVPVAGDNVREPAWSFL